MGGYVTVAVAREQVDLFHAVRHRGVVGPTLDIVGDLLDGPMRGLAHGEIIFRLLPYRASMSSAVTSRQSRARNLPHPSMT